MIELRDELERLNANRGKYFRVFPGYITHIRFPRYKNMADGARLDFDFPVTALVGSNGSGKTSVLNALYGAPTRNSTGQYWFSTKVDPIEEGEGSPSRYIYGHYNAAFKDVVETRKARVRKVRNGRQDPNYWEPTKETTGDQMVEPDLPAAKKLVGRSKDRWNPVNRKVLYINFRKELSAFDKYFYFGKDPALFKPAEGANTAPTSRRIATKMDQVRYDAGLLARVIEAGDTSVMYRNRKLATENRLLTKEELDIVSYVLGREYDEARWIRHRLFKGDGGLSIVFKTKFGKYSEAFAGSGEVAVTSCVAQVLAADRGTLVLLDEPEVSLHPGAQERLLAFLTQMARKRQLQVVFSTHSPHLIAALPDDAIKTFHQSADGRFAVIPSTHPYAAFRRLGATGGNEVHVLVEDRLAQSVVQQALLRLEDDAERKVFRVDFPSGGAGAILKYRIPSLMDLPGHTLVLLDGDQRKLPVFEDPDQIPAADDGLLEAKIFAATGVNPELSPDGGAGGVDQAQLTLGRRKYLAWIRTNLAYIPTTCPEELVLRAANAMGAAQNAQECKTKLAELAKAAYGMDITSERIDMHGETLLAMNKANSPELVQLAQALRNYLQNAHAA